MLFIVSYTTNLFISFYGTTVLTLSTLLMYNYYDLKYYVMCFLKKIVKSTVLLYKN